MSVSVGLVGFGNAGRYMHCPLVLAAGMQVRGVVTRQADAVKETLGDVQVHADFDTLLNDPAIDLVVIATPNHLHAPQAMAALRAGKHVVIDKPFALDSRQADELLAIAQAGKGCLAVFHNRRWDSDFLTLKQVLDAGRLGEIYSAQLRWDRFRPVVQTRWREHREYGGGLFADLGTHLIDQVMCLFGQPEWVQADLLTQRPGAVVEDGFELLLGKGRLRVQIGCSSVAADNALRYRLHGTLGSLSKTGLDMQEAQLRAGMDPLFAQFGVEPAEQHAQLIDGNGGCERIPSVRGDWVEFYRGVRRAIESQTPVPVSGFDAKQVMRVIDAARLSHLEQRRVGLS